jgi:hypothetical protein
MHATRISALAAAAILAATSVSARSVSAAYPQSVADALQDNGYRAELSTDSEGDPMIISHASGARFAIFFYGCENNRDCKDMSFTASFAVDDTITLGSLNSWNSTKLMGRAYLDDDNDPVVMHFVAGVDAMPAPTFKRLMDRWEIALEEFTDFIGW